MEVSRYWLIFGSMIPLRQVSSFGSHLGFLFSFFHVCTKVLLNAWFWLINILLNLQKTLQFNYFSYSSIQQQNNQDPKYTDKGNKYTKKKYKDKQCPCFTLHYLCIIYWNRKSYTQECLKRQEPVKCLKIKHLNNVLRCGNSISMSIIIDWIMLCVLASLPPQVCIGLSNNILIIQLFLTYSIS